MTADRIVYGSDPWIDTQGDVWTLGDDGLMHTPETRPFPAHFVEQKWGPLRLVHPCGHVDTVRGCGGCDRGAIEYVRDDHDGVWRSVESES